MCRKGGMEGRRRGAGQLAEASRAAAIRTAPGGEAAAPRPRRESDSTRKFCSNFFVTAPGRGERELSTYRRGKYRRGIEAGAGGWAGQEGAQPSTKLGASQGQTLQPLVLLAGECHSMLTQGGFLGSSSWWRCRPRALRNAAPGKLEFHSIAVKYCKYFSGRWGQRGGAGQGDLSVPAPPACLLSRGV